MPYTIGTMLPPGLSTVTFQLATRADPTNFLATVYTATPRASLTTQYEFSVSVAAGDYLVKQLQAPFASGYVRLSGSSDVLHFDSLDDLIRYDATQAAIAGSNNSPIVLPAIGVTPPAIEGSLISMFLNAGAVVPIPILNSDGTNANLTGKTLQFVVTEDQKTQVLLIADGSLPKSANVVTVTLPGTLANRVGRQLTWSIRVTNADNAVIAHGRIDVSYAAKPA